MANADLIQNLIPIVLFRPVLFFAPEKTARQIRILLLKGTHAPLIGAIWMYERWEVFALRREAVERAALSFGFDTISTRTKQDQPQLIEAKKSSKPSNKKHTLINSRKVQVPAALLSKASKRKQAGPNKDTRGRVNTVPAVVEQDPTPGNVAGPGPAVPVPQSAVSAPGEATSPIDALPTSDVAMMMRMLKELSAQVEEVRASLAKHESGSLE